MYPMDFLKFFLHLDKELAAVISQYGAWTYALLFFIIFCETGFVVTPFLPGDSLLFAAGAFAATGSFNIIALFFLLSFAAILGDTVNYSIGRRVGPKIFFQENVMFLNKEHLNRARHFYEMHGRKTIILARFVPIVRTFAPFLAGIGQMRYREFFMFNVAGGLLWISLFLFGGYIFGNIPVVKNNFTFVIFGIIFVSLIPGILEYIRHIRSKQKTPPLN